MGREERMKTQESFKHDPTVQVLLATDAAGEGINLQRAHLMVNYDLPWNPNRIEQRFGRFHRIGQTEVCHLWNLLADETREGEVYRTLLQKLEEARRALGGQVFDVLGKMQFGGKPLRELLIEAIRYGERPEVRSKLTQVVENAFDPSQLQNLLEERALAHDAMDASRVFRIREEMERAGREDYSPTILNHSSSKRSTVWGERSSNANRDAMKSPESPLRCETATGLSASGNRCFRATSELRSKNLWLPRRASRLPPLSAPGIRCSIP